MKLFLMLLFTLSFEAIFSKPDPQNLIGFGYWVHADDMEEIKLKDLYKIGTTDLFLKYDSFERIGRKKVLNFISEAKDFNIRVHLYYSVFGKNGNMIDPRKVDFDSILNEIKKYASTPNLAGFSLDYIRYSGSYEAEKKYEPINEFLPLAVDAIHETNEDLIISASIMPAKEKAKEEYGQDYKVFSKYMDVVLPMVYKGDDHDTEWITITGKWYVENSQKAAVWIGILSYKSDDDTTPLSSSDLKKDIEAALEPKPNGVILFRYGLCNSHNFKDYQ